MPGLRPDRPKIRWHAFQERAQALARKGLDLSCERRAINLFPQREVKDAAAQDFHAIHCSAEGGPAGTARGRAWENLFHEYDSRRDDGNDMSVRSNTWRVDISA